MSKLREVIQEAYDLDTELNRMNTTDIDKAVDEDVKYIKDLFLELIGEDELTFGPQNEAGDISENDYILSGRNEEKQILRTKINDL